MIDYKPNVLCPCWVNFGRTLRLWLNLLLFMLLACPTLSRAEHDHQNEFVNYHWGRGLNIPALNLNIGGYFKASYRRIEASEHNNVQLDDLSLFITWTPHDRLRIFAEIEQHNWLSNDGVAQFSKGLSIERLFAEFLLNETSTLRFGKYLTPVGRWNVIHSAPLVWTTNRPKITDDLTFAPRANGLLLTHSRLINDHNLDVSVYLDDSTDLEPRSINNIVFHKAAGARVNYELTEQFQIGGSYLAYQKLSDVGLPTHHLFGIDALWQHEGYEVLFESLYHTQEAQIDTLNLEEKGLFVQGVAPIGGKVFAVARYEYFNSNIFQSFNQEKETHIGLGGLAWRPYVPLVLKAEYRFGDNNRIIAPSGFFLSLATFF